MDEVVKRLKENLFSRQKRAFLFYSSFYTDVISAFEEENERKEILWSIVRYAFSDETEKENIRNEVSNSYLKLVFQSIDIQNRRYQNRVLIDYYKDEVSKYMLIHYKNGEKSIAYYDKASEVQKHLNKLAYDVGNKDYSFEEIYYKILGRLNSAGVSFSNPNHVAQPSRDYTIDESRVIRR